MTAFELNQYLKKLRWGETQDTIALLRNNEIMANQMMSQQLAATNPGFSLEDLQADQSFQDEGLIQIRHHGRFTGTPRHGHQVFEIMYVREGTVIHSMDDGEIELCGGSFLVMAPGTFHATKPCGINDIAVNFLIDPNHLYGSFFSSLSDNPLFSEFFLQHKKPSEHGAYFVVDCSQSEEVYSVASMLLCEYFEPAICSSDNVTALFSVLLNSIYRLWAREHGNPTDRERTQSAITVRQALQYISVHHATVSLSELSSRFGYAPKYLGRLFTKYTGQSFTELKQQAALQQACVLLSHSDQTIANIAQTVGFSNVTFFYSVFKRYFDLSPSEYRRQNRVSASEPLE